ncbi:MAG TPA: cytochrome c oxidase assembly protein [Burkholderiaceae bacterium]|nr:cytochrome c oxidase assembly protein [Burkholderiaceae bacterium]
MTESFGSNDTAGAKDERRDGNLTMLRKLAVMTLVMFGFGYALVPFYEKLCEVTGINFLTNKDADAERLARNTQVDTSRLVTIEFDANSRGPWSFKPEKNTMQVHPGELVTVTYDITNNEPRAMAGQAIPSYAPLRSAQYFKKLECFCFQQQALPSRETRRFPVVFVVDPKLPRDVHTITLSYTFFEIPGATTASTAAKTSALN